MLRTHTYSEMDLSSYFSQYGNIERVQLFSRNTPKQLVIITYSSGEEAQAAFLNGAPMRDGISRTHQFLGNFVIVRMATDKPGFVPKTVKTQEDSKDASSTENQDASGESNMPANNKPVATESADNPGTGNSSNLPETGKPATPSGPVPLMSLNVPHTSNQDKESLSKDEQLSTTPVESLSTNPDITPGVSNQFKMLTP